VSVVLEQILEKSETQTIEMLDQCKISLGLGIKANISERGMRSKRIPISTGLSCLIAFNDRISGEEYEHGWRIVLVFISMVELSLSLRKER
jgi:hypothetical protein